MAYVTLSRRTGAVAKPDRATKKRKWLKRVYAAMLLPVILILVLVRPSLFDTDYE